MKFAKVRVCIGTALREQKAVSSKSAHRRAKKKKKLAALKHEQQETQEQVDARVLKEGERLSAVLFTSPQPQNPNLIRVNKKLVTNRREVYYAHQSRKRGANLSVLTSNKRPKLEPTRII